MVDAGVRSAVAAEPLPEVPAAYSWTLAPISGWLPAIALPEIAGPEKLFPGGGAVVVDTVELPQPITAPVIKAARQASSAVFRRSGIMEFWSYYSIRTQRCKDNGGVTDGSGARQLGQVGCAGEACD